MLWTVRCFFLLGGFFMNSVSAGKKCRGERSINGMALQGFVFKKFYVRAFHECDISCERDITCQSCNFVVGEKSCELNNRTREARPEHFRSDPARFYVSRLKERGMYKSRSLSTEVFLEAKVTGCKMLQLSDAVVGGRGRLTGRQKKNLNLQLPSFLFTKSVLSFFY